MTEWIWMAVTDLRTAPATGARTIALDEENAWRANVHALQDILAKTARSWSAGTTALAEASAQATVASVTLDLQATTVLCVHAQMIARAMDIATMALATATKATTGPRVPREPVRMYAQGLSMDCVYISYASVCLASRATTAH